MSARRSSTERKKGPIDESEPESKYEIQFKLELRKKLPDLDRVSDLTILRFIRGYNQAEKPEEKVFEMLTKFAEWRKKENVDVVARTKIEYIEQVWDMWPSGCHGLGKSFHPIYIERVGYIDPQALAKKGLDMLKIMPVHIQVMEALCNLKERLSRAQNKNIYKHIVILDLEGIGTKHVTKSFYGPLKQLIDIDQFFYPETLHRMFIVNAPWMVKALWTIMSPWIDPLTKARFIWGKDKLDEYIDKDQLPKFLGGTCKCRDGRCLKVPFVSGKESTTEQLGLLIPLPDDEKRSTTSEEKSDEKSKLQSISSSSSSSSSSTSSTSDSSSSTSTSTSTSTSSTLSSAEKKDEKKQDEN